MAVNPRCRKRREPAARCPWCPPLFPRTRRGRGNLTVPDGHACSPQRMSQNVKFAMTKMGANPDRFSGVSARKGGLRRQSRPAYTRLYSFCRPGMVKRRQRGTTFTFGTQRPSCKSSGRLNCDGRIAPILCGLCASRRGSRGRAEPGFPDIPGPMMGWLGAPGGPQPGAGPGDPSESASPP